MALYERATSAAEDDAAASLSRNDVEALSSSYVDFADSHADPVTAERVAGAHAERFGKYVKPAQGKKRRSEVNDGGSAMKKAAVEATPASEQPDATAGAQANGSAPTAAATSAAPSGTTVQPLSYIVSTDSMCNKYGNVSSISTEPEAVCATAGAYTAYATSMPYSAPVSNPTDAAAVSQAGYYPAASAAYGAGYGYEGYYGYQQQYGYTYPGY